MENIYLYIGLGALFVIIIVALVSKKFKANLSKNGFNISGDKTENKDSVDIKNIKNKSDVDVNTTNNQNIKIEDVDSSNIKINKK